MEMIRFRFSKLHAVVVAVVVLTAACGDGGAASTTIGETTSVPPSSTLAPTIAPTTPPPTSTSPATTTTTASSTTTAPPTSAPTSLPGDPMDFGPRAGDVLGVVGVAHDDVLNVRLAPGTDQTIVARLAPLEDEVIALGNTRQLPSSIWYEVDADGRRGWASAAYLAYLGDTSDMTALLIAALGETPEAETMLDLGQIVAEASASDDPASRIVLSVAPTVGDLGEVTFDVIGLGDDSVFGIRLHVFGTPSEGGEGFILKSVEQTVLCGRGVSGGLCV
ncbi:MAG: SH3 domain-containing protein [Acidimicrobiia bacterium]|nr:SH3 domain-containing protein [Acidimicrobiia bacterium]